MSEEALARLATSSALRPSDLDPLVELMAALENSSESQGGEQLSRGIAASLGDDVAIALCTGAPRPADVAARFFRLRALLATAAQLRER
ncbi:MAG: hypothetical protein Q8O67_08490 [Deltaproteobacteria bacterium]|nr:hypothetical protein [Deltaproteobacteria bacterium]